MHTIVIIFLTHQCKHVFDVPWEQHYKHNSFEHPEHILLLKIIKKKYLKTQSYLKACISIYIFWMHSYTVKQHFYILWHLQYM